MNADFAEQIKSIATLANDSWTSGYKEGFRAGQQEGLRMAQELIAGKTVAEVIAKEKVT